MADFTRERTPTPRYNPGDHVRVNGHEGIIISQEWTVMYNVRLASGIVCVDMSAQVDKRVVPEATV